MTVNRLKKRLTLHTFVHKGGREAFFLLKNPKKTAVSMANSKQKHIFVISK